MRIAALPGVAAVVADGAGEVGVVGTRGLGAVVQHELDGPGGAGPGDRREPVAVGTAEVVLRRQGVRVGVLNVLVADAGVEHAEPGESQAVGCEAGVVVLLDEGRGGGDIDARNAVHVLAARETLFGTELELARAERVGQHRLGGVQPPGVVRP